MNITFPLSLQVLDELCTPWVCGYAGEARCVPSLCSLLDSKELTEGFGVHPQSPNAPVAQVYIAPASADRAAIGQCLKQGWWCATLPLSSMLPFPRDVRNLQIVFGVPTAVQHDAYTQKWIYHHPEYSLVFEAVDNQLKTCLYFCNHF